jgi:TonB family protein
MSVACHEAATAQDIEVMKSRALTAMRRASLVGGGVRPYHLQANITTYDGAGKNPLEGRAEIWARAQDFRMSVSFPNASYSLVRNAVGSYSSHTGDLPFFASKALSALLQPVEFQGFDTQLGTLEKRSFRKIETDCLSITAPQVAIVNGPRIPKHELCLDPARDDVRAIVDGEQTFVREDYVDFDDHEVAKILDLELSGTDVVKIRIETLENMNLTDDDFKPAEGMARLETGPMHIPSAVMAGKIIKHESPKYPGTARAAHIQGTVILHAIIDKDGSIGNLTVISSPDPVLSDASMKAVKKWTYEPYQLNGEPTQVDTTITVTFNLGGH